MKKHITVLQQEAVDGLNLQSTAIAVDATFGAGGHAKLITEKLGSKGIFIGIDADELAINAGKEKLRDAQCTTHLITANFRTIDSILDHLHIKEVDAILADLGWRMEQFSGNGKGFSFLIDEPLIMTYGDHASYPFVAKDIINEWDETDIKNVLKAYGEERFSGRIARHIVEARKKEPITTTAQLVAVIEKAVPSFYLRAKIHPATRTFQALRIAVNDEFDALDEFIKKAIARLKSGGRLAIISFHSTEDRIVKHLFKNFAHDQIGDIITKRPIASSREEITQNPRSRSAKLRIFRKT